jgi:hypothetical protein
VLDVQFDYRQVNPSHEAGLDELPRSEEDEDMACEEVELSESEMRILRVSGDTLLCSLDHEVEVVEL